MGVYQRDGRWMVYYTDVNGSRRDKSFGRGDNAYAEALAFDQEKKSASKQSRGEVSSSVSIESEQPLKSEEVPVHTSPFEIIFKDLADKYIEHLEVSGRTETNTKKLKKMIRAVTKASLGELHNHVRSRRARAAAPRSSAHPRRR